MDERDLRRVVQALNLGIAVVRPGDWTIVFENGRFFEYFPPDPTVVPDSTTVATPDSDNLGARIPTFDPARAEERLTSGRGYTLEVEVQLRGRTVPVRINLRPLSDDPTGRIVVECADVSKEVEIQYMLDSYSTLAERNARDLEKEKERVEKLLLNIMPRAVLEELKDFGATTPQRFESATILMLDFVGFTDMAISEDAAGIITELNDIFTAFDRIVETFNCERLKTIGDAYIAVSGVPEAAPEHAQNMARVALRMRRYLERRNAAHPIEWRARFGMNTGPVIGSLVGIQKYVYDLFGPGVNLAARMEALSEPMRITVSQHTHDLLEDNFILSARSAVDIKGFGQQEIYFLEGEIGGKR